MDIAIVSNGLEHAETTLEHMSLGGSETAALMCAKELSALGNCVTLFSRMPPKGRVDYIPSGTIGRDGVRYQSIDEYANAITGATWDLLIVSRDPSALSLPHQAKKAVLWLHDLATQPFCQALSPVVWNLDEIWTVSEFHRQQVHEVTDYPLTHIKALRNGIIPLPEPEEAPLRDPTLLYYGSRPERGLIYLVMPGGIMEQLPQYRLEFSMYGDPNRLPKHIQELYKQIFQFASRLPNVMFIGSLTQAEVRDKLRVASALVYPSDFEETSCILAREAISVKCPIIACNVGAMVETVGNCGTLAPPRSDYDSDQEFNQAFAHVIKTELSNEAVLTIMESACQTRCDLDWASVAVDMEDLGQLIPDRPVLARAKALVEVGDAIPALALLELHAGKPSIDAYHGTLLTLYNDVLQEDTSVAYQDRYAEEPPTYGDLSQTGRFQAVAELLKQAPKNARVLDYGCCEGNQILNLARLFPQMSFTGYDHATVTFSRAGEVMDANGITNVYFTDDEDEFNEGGYDVVLLTEVLEHVAEPWKLIDRAEMLTKPGGMVITTTPIGPWEAKRIFSNKRDHDFPEHLWHLDKNAMERMCSDRANFSMTFVPSGICEATMLLLGNLVTWWTTEAFTPNITPLDALEKAFTSTPRIQTPAAAMIAYNEEDDILACLKSLSRAGIRDVSIALGPCTDYTMGIIDYFLDTHPWMNVITNHVPKIEAGNFGFDDARNVSYDAVKGDYDWVLWIDCDEVLLGEPRRFLRNNHFASYAIPQHHFSCDPRGAPPQVDRPARLVRTERGFKCYGKIHEHFELGLNEGPGHSMVLPEVDLFHKGYKTEAIRRSRFKRNLPFLVWDMEVNPTRKLAKYLWLRDLIHQMRYALAENDHASAARFAEDAIKHYNEFWRDMLHFGSGLVQGFQYVSEARQLLGRGAPVHTTIALGDGRSVDLQGMIEEPNELTRLVDHLMTDECKRAKSRYR